MHWFRMPRLPKVMNVNGPQISCYLANNRRAEPVNLHFHMYKTLGSLR